MSSLIPPSTPSPSDSACNECTPDPDSLTLRLSAFKRSFLPQLQRILGDERYRAFTEQNAQLQALHPEQHALRVGDVAPDFALPNQHGDVVHLGTLLQSHHVIVHFYRGSWCPYCNLALQAHATYFHEYDDFGGLFLAITPQLSAKTAAQMAEHNFPFHILSDAHLETIPAYHLMLQLTPELRAIHTATDGLNVDLATFYGDNLGKLPIPATYVIERNTGRIVWAHVDADFTLRADPLDIIERLQEMKREEDTEDL